MKLNPTASYVLKTVTLSDPQTKVFVNVCTDPQVPEPDTIDPAEIVFRIKRNEDWIVPIVVSPARADIDKAGNECLVYDCCMNPNVVTAGHDDPGVRILTNETCAELIEDASKTLLSREFAFPRMRSKGPLQHTIISDESVRKPAKTLDELLATATEPNPLEIIKDQTPAKKPMIQVIEDPLPEYELADVTLASGKAQVLKLQKQPTNVYIEQDALIIENGSETSQVNLKFSPASVRAIALPSGDTHIYAMEAL